MYPINVARNIARDAALTHFIFASDIELYPSPEFVPKFLEMIERNENEMQRAAPKVYPITVFEVAKGAKIPMNKTELLSMLKAKTAVTFHKRVCLECHSVPNQKEWLEHNETKGEN